MTYQFKTYTDPFILPPKVGQTLITKGMFNLIFFTPKFMTDVPQKQQIRFKMWGEDNYRYTSHSTPIRFQIKCNNTNFSTYLRDMKFLKVQIVDSRNNTLIGNVIVNLMLYVNPEPLFNDWDCPFLPMRQTFDIIKHNVMKTKIGELQLSINCQFWKNPPIINQLGLSKKQERKQNTITGNSDDKQIFLPNSMKSISFKKDINDWNNKQSFAEIPQAKNTYQPQFMQSVNSHNIRSLSNKKPFHKPAFILPTNQQSNVNKFAKVNVQAQVAKLKLDANLLFNESTSSETNLPSNLRLKILKATIVSTQPLSLFIQHPTKIGYKKIKTILTQISSISATRIEVKYNKQFKILDLKDVSQHYLRFIFRNNKKQAIGIAQSLIMYLINSEEYKLSILNKNNKQVGKLFIESIDQHHKQKRQQTTNETIGDNPLTNVVLKRQQSPKNIHQHQIRQNKTEPKPQQQLMIIINVIKISLIEQEQDPNLYKKVTFKFQKQIYETKMIKKGNFNYTLTTCIKNDIMIENPFIMFQTWGSGVTNKLLGIGKYDTNDLNKLKTQGVIQANLEPILLYDSNLPLSSITKKQTIGYLSIKIRVGTARQISKALQSPPMLHYPSNNYNNRRQRDNQTPSHNLSSPQTNTDRISNQQSKQQNLRSKQSSSLQPQSSRRSLQDQQNSKNQVVQIHNLMETITSFFSAISDSKQKIELILKQMNLSGDMKITQFEKILHNVLEQHDQYWDALAFFYGQDDHINTLEFLKSFSSFVNFKQILIQQLTVLLLELNSELNKYNVGLDIVENKLLQYAQFGFISNQNIREVFRIYRVDSFLIDRIIQTYASTKQNQMIVSEFIHHIKCAKFANPIESLNYNITNLEHLIQNSVIDAINSEAESVNLIINTFINKNMDVKSICQLLESLQVDISIWEALLLIQSIKIFFKQDLDLVEGIISSKVLFSWLKSVININLIPRLESVGSVGMPTEPDVVVLRTQRTETNPDDIANIADLLKQKDKMQYDDSSSLPKKQVNDQQSSYNMASKVLQQSRPYVPSVQQTQRQPTSSYQPSSPSIKKHTQQQLRVSELKTSNFKYLKYINFDYLTLGINLLSSHQILIKKQQGVIKYYSSSTFFQYIDINNIFNYKQKSQGLQFNCHSFNAQNQNTCKGLISLQDIFKIQTSSKKVCILYNNQMKIIGRIVTQLTYVQKQQQTQVIQKEFLFIRLIKIDSSLNQKAKIDFNLNGLTKISNIEMKKQYQIQLDNKIYKSKGEFRIISEHQKLNAEFSIQNLFTSKIMRLDIPILKESCEYFGLLQVEISIKEEQEIMAKIEIQNNPKTSAFIFIDSLTYVGQQNRDLQVSFSVSNQFQTSSRVYENIPLQKPLTVSFISQLHSLDLFKLSQNICIKIMDGKSKLQIGNALFKLSMDEIKHFNFVDNINISLKNKLNILLNLKLRAIVVNKTDGIKLTNVLQNLKYDKVEKMKEKMQEIDYNTIRSSLRQQKVSLSQIQHFLQILTKDKGDILNSLFKKNKFDNYDNAVSLLRQFQFYDIEKTGKVQQQHLKRILQSYSIDRIQNNAQLLNLQQNNQVCYLPYLQYNQSKQTQQQQKQQPIIQINQQQNQLQQQKSPQKQDDFKRICSEINKLHSMLTKARQE